MTKTQFHRKRFSIFVPLLVFTVHLAEILQKYHPSSQFYHLLKYYRNIIHPVNFNVYLKSSQFYHLLEILQKYHPSSQFYHLLEIYSSRRNHLWHKQGVYKNALLDIVALTMV